MAKKPRRVYDKTTGRMVAVDDFRRSSFRPNTSELAIPVYQDGNPDRLSITQRVQDHPEARRQRVSVGSLSKYDELLQCIYDAVLITDLDGYVQEVNSRSEHNFMWTDRQLKELNIVDLIAGADHELMKEIRKNVTDERYTILEAVCQRADNTRFHAEIVVNRISAQDQHGLCFFVRDSTRKKQIEEEIKDASMRLLDAEKAKARLDTLSAVFYELNNPLQILLSMAYLDKNEEYKHQLDRITRVLDRFRRTESPGDIADDTAGRAAAEGDNKGDVPCDPGRIMIVDDEAMLRNIFVEALSSAFAGCKVDSAGDGKEASDLFKTHHHCVIVLDVSMPVMNGEECFAEIRSHCAKEGWAPPRVVFCAGFGMGEKIRQIVGDGAVHGLIRKPFGIDDLVKIVGDHMPERPA